jgi:hypothetical protein
MEPVPLLGASRYHCRWGCLVWCSEACLSGYIHDHLEEKAKERLDNEMEERLDNEMEDTCEKQQRDPLSSLGGSIGHLYMYSTAGSSYSAFGSLP